MTSFLDLRSSLISRIAAFTNMQIFLKRWDCPVSCDSIKWLSLNNTEDSSANKLPTAGRNCGGSSFPIFYFGVCHHWPPSLRYKLSATGDWLKILENQGSFLNLGLEWYWLCFKLANNFGCSPCWSCILRTVGGEVHKTNSTAYLTFWCHDQGNGTALDSSLLLCCLT